MSAARAQLKPTPALEFEADAHRYTLNGRVLPSVTTVLEPYSGIDAAIAVHGQAYIDAAAAFGSNVHLATHLYDQDELDWGSLDPALVPFVRAWQLCLEETGGVVIASELRVHHRALRYAGTLDKLVAIGRDDCLIDVKATADIPRTVGPQTAGYQEALLDCQGRRVQKRYCCHLRADGTYKLQPLTTPTDFAVFQAALTLHRAGWFPSLKRA